MVIGASYKEAGVDIDSAERLIKLIKPLAKATRRPGANADLGGFGGVFDLKATKYKDPLLVSGTDGVGTKLKIAQALKKHDTIGIDLVAMCVNDVVVQGAEPLFFLDYFASNALQIEVAHDVIKGIAKGCKEAGCALIGGETAEMPGMYEEGDYDLAGFAVGAVERKDLLPKKDLKAGDVIIGIASSGIHSNGYSLIRYLVDRYELSYEAKIYGNTSLGDILLKPTKIYVKTCLELAKKAKVKAFAHITGGGITENTPRVFPSNLAAHIDLTKWKLPEIFKWIMYTGNVEGVEMLRTYNCGIGMIAVVPKSSLKVAEQVLKKNKEKYWVIGEVIKRKPGADSVVYSNLDHLGTSF